MKVKYEYKIEEFPLYHNKVEDYLNGKGEEGWELIDTFRHVSIKRYTFKRIKK